MKMNADYFTTRSLPSNDGYTYTLPTRLGHILRLAELMYGPRDRSWTILGIEFNLDSNASPQIWYPDNCKNIAIQLNSAALEDTVLACYQLAHEAIHLLAPSGSRLANVLEEGVAVYFSLLYVTQHLKGKVKCNHEAYIRAYYEVSKLLNVDPDAIKKLRGVEPCFYKMDLNTFVDAGVNVSDDLKHNLLKKFCY